MSEKRVAPPDGGSGDLVLIQRHLENLSAGEILKELDARMEEMTDQSCDPELIRLYLDVLEEKEPLGLELDPGKRKIAEYLSPCGKIGVKRQGAERS